jgi:hypothetical protein
MLKLMARIPALKSVADNLIGSREFSLTRQMGEALASHGFQFKTRIKLPDSAGEIDLLAFNIKHPDELRILEAKAILDVDEVNEVEQATLEQLKGQEQLRKTIRILNAMSPAAKSRLWSKPNWKSIDKLYGVVLTPSALPNAAYDHTQLPAITLWAINNHLYPRDFRSPRRFWDACVKKRWLKPFSAGETVFQGLKVGFVTYEIPYSSKTA